MWLIPRTLTPDAMDSKPFLEGLGFTEITEHTVFVYRVRPPEGWIKVSEGRHTWGVRDEESIERFVFHMNDGPKNRAFWVSPKST